MHHKDANLRVRIPIPIYIPLHALMSPSARHNDWQGRAVVKQPYSKRDDPQENTDTSELRWKARKTTSSNNAAIYTSSKTIYPYRGQYTIKVVDDGWDSLSLSLDGIYYYGKNMDSRVNFFSRGKVYRYIYTQCASYNGQCSIYRFIFCFGYLWVGGNETINWIFIALGYICILLKCFANCDSLRGLLPSGKLYTSSLKFSFQTVVVYIPYNDNRRASAHRT